jgi:AraC-like DNA-binding protein
VKQREPTLWSIALKGALDAFTAIGLDRGRICAEAGIDPALIDDPDARVPISLSARIWPAAAKQWDAPGLGLWAGGALQFGKLEALDYAFATARTLAEGLQRLEKYWQLVTGGATGMRADAHGTVELLGYGQPDLRDYGLAAVVLRLGIFSVTPLLVTVAGPARAAPREYVARLGCPVELDARKTTIALAPAALSQPLAQRFPGLRTSVDHALDLLLDRALASRDPLAEVRREVMTLLGPSEPTLEAVAARLHVSPRQLQRRLAEGGSSFSALVADARRALAELYLERGTMNVTEVAYLLGYSEPSAFSRAFKRWTGVAPENYRRRGAQRAPKS